MVVILTVVVTLVGCTGVVALGVAQWLRSSRGASSKTQKEEEEMKMCKTLTSAATTTGNKSRQEFVASRLAAAQKRSKYGTVELADSSEGKT